MYIQKEGEKVAVKTLSLLVKEEGHTMCVIWSTSWIHMDPIPCFFSQHYWREITKVKAVPSPVDSWASRVEQRHTMIASAQCLGSVSGSWVTVTYAEEILTRWSPKPSVEHCCIYAYAPPWSVTLGLLGIQSPWLPNWVSCLVFKAQTPKLLPACSWWPMSLFRCWCATCEERVHLLHSGAREMSEINFNLCC